MSLDKPLIMGVLNVSPDSFYASSRIDQETDFLSRIKEMISQGMQILDIGAYSSRPGADFVSEEQEIERLSIVLKSIQKNFPELTVSVDTFRSEVARFAVKNGASIINDISAGNLDEKMFETIAELQVPYIIMHMKGSPKNMMEHTDYDAILKEIYTYFDLKIKKLEKLGVKDILIDLGFGFSKTLDQNYFLLEHQAYFKHLKRPILTGISRKSMIYKLLGSSPEEALNGTSILNFKALESGSNILRVHDVKEAKEVVAIWSKLEEQRKLTM